MASLKLLSSNPVERRQAVRELRDGADESKLPLIEKALATETDASLKTDLGLLRAAVLVSSSDTARRLEAAKLLADSRTPATKALLIERLKPGVEPDPAVRAQLTAALAGVAAAAVGLLLQVTLKIGAKQFLNLRDLCFVLGTFYLVAFHHVSLPVVLFLIAPIAIILCRPKKPSQPHE
jgi:hypothetical protein